MDPVSIVSGIGGLIQLTDLVMSRTWPFLKELKNQREEISKLLAEVASLGGVLHSIHLLEQGCAIQIDQEDILNCQQILEELWDKLRKGDNSSHGKRDQVKQFAYQLYFPYERVEMQQILERLERLKSTFNLALTAESIACQIDVKADVKAIKEELFRQKEIEAKIEINEARKKVLEFFGRVSPRENHAMSMKLRHEGTGLWLLREPSFNRWLHNWGSHIWLYGIPGARKTILASLLIEKVLQVRGHSEAVAFFYCDYKDSAKQNPCYILASIASQLGIQREQAYDILEEDYRRVRKLSGTNDVKHLKPETLLDILDRQLALFDHTTFMIDGLDECGDSTANFCLIISYL